MTPYEWALSDANLLLDEQAAFRAGWDAAIEAAAEALEGHGDDVSGEATESVERLATTREVPDGD